MAGLGLGLGISSGTVSSGDAVTPTPGRTTNFGRLVAQDDEQLKPVELIKNR